MMKARKHKNKIGMTLVEIILAMAILSLVVILMTPVLVSGFKNDNPLRQPPCQCKKCCRRCEGEQFGR